MEIRCLERLLLDTTSGLGTQREVTHGLLNHLKGHQKLLEVLKTELEDVKYTHAAEMERIHQDFEDVTLGRDVQNSEVQNLTIEIAELQQHVQNSREVKLSSIEELDSQQRGSPTPLQRKTQDQPSHPGRDSNYLRSTSDPRYDPKFDPFMPKPSTKQQGVKFGEAADSASSDQNSESG
jgi:hypothetical protein